MPQPKQPDYDDELDYGDGKKLPKVTDEELASEGGEPVEIPEEAFMGDPGRSE